MAPESNGSDPHLLRPGEIPVDAELTVVRDDDAYMVVVEDDEEDWLVRFETADDFDAKAWAENMAMVYNRRRNRPGGWDARFGARRPG